MEVCNTCCKQGACPYEEEFMKAQDKTSRICGETGLFWATVKCIGWTASCEYSAEGAAIAKYYRRWKP